MYFVLFVSFVVNFFSSLVAVLPCQAIRIAGRSDDLYALNFLNDLNGVNHA
jgi:hypothetical protein